MSQRGLNKDLQQKVRKYYEYLFYEQMNEEEEGANVFNNLTTLLKKQVWIDVYGKLLKSKPIFLTNFSDDFINMLSLKVKEKKFGPEEYIFVNGDFSNYIFIIISGEVDQKGDMFGQLEFFSQQKRTSTVKTKCVTSVAYLNYNDFLVALQVYENDREIYYQIKDQINLYKNYSNIDLKCPICYEYGRHQTHECNSINFIRYKEKIIINAKTYNSQERQDRNIIQENFKQQKTIKNTKNIIGSLKNLPSYKIRNSKYNSIFNNRIVKESGFCIIVDALAEQIQETLSRDEDTELQQRITSGEIKEAQSEQDQEDIQQEEISVSEDENGNNGSDYNEDLQVKSINKQRNQNQSDYLRQLRMKTKQGSYLKNKSNILSENKIHVEVSAEQEESQWNMPNTQRSQKKSKSVKLSPKNSMLNLDSDRKIEICKSQQFIDYTYAIKNDINLYLIPYAYVIDEQFKFPQEVILSVCGNLPNNFQFTNTPTKFQNPISASSQYNKQISQKSDLLVSQNTSNSSISPTIFQMHQNVQSSNRYIEPQRIINNPSYSINNTQNFIQLSPTTNGISNRINNLSNYQGINNALNNNQPMFLQSPRNLQNSFNPQIQQNSLNQINPLSQINIQSQTNFGNINSFGAALNSINNQQNSSDYNSMITQNPFAPQYVHSSSPYNNRLGTYGIYLPALQQLEPINELQSKEIVSSDESQEGDGEKLSASRKSNIGSKRNQVKRRHSKEPSINLHMKSYMQKEGNNSQHIESNQTIAANHMEAISPQKINQISHETIPIQAEQDTILNDENYLAIMSARIKKATEQHVQFAEEDEQTSNKSGHTLQVQYGQNIQNTLNSLNILNNQNFFTNQNTLSNQITPKNQKNNQNLFNNQNIPNNQSTPKNNQITYWNNQNNQNVYNNLNSFNNTNAITKQNTLNNQNTIQKQNTLASFEQTQQNPNGTGKNKRSSLKPSLFSNNQLTYMNSMSLTNGNQTTRLPSSQNQSDLTNNAIYQKMSTYNQIPNSQYTNVNQGSVSQLGLNQNTTLFKSLNGFSRSVSYGFDPSSLYSKLMSRQSVQFKFKRDQDYCALIYKKHINLKAVDKVYEDIYNNFDVMKNFQIYFWHNNFNQISIKDSQKFVRRKFHSTATTIKQRKASRTTDTYIKNTYRTSLFQFTRNNSNAFHRQSSLFTINKKSINSLNHIKYFQDKNQKQLTTQKTLQI